MTSEETRPRNLGESGFKQYLVKKGFKEGNPMSRSGGSKGEIADSRMGIKINMSE